MLVGHPLDLVKVRMQTGGGAGAGTFKLLQTTFANEGVTGLYRGVSAPILAIAPVFAVCFWGYDMGKRVVRAISVSPSSPEEQPMTISQLSLAGALSAIPTTAIMAPSERIKCLLQVQANEIAKGGVAKYTGVTDCAKQVYKEGGFRSVFKGSFATVRLTTTHDQKMLCYFCTLTTKTLNCSFFLMRISFFYIVTTRFSRKCCLFRCVRMDEKRNHGKTGY